MMYVYEVHGLGLIRTGLHPALAGRLEEIYDALHGAFLEPIGLEEHDLSWLGVPNIGVPTISRKVYEVLSQFPEFRRLEKEIKGAVWQGALGFTMDVQRVGDALKGTALFFGWFYGEDRWDLVIRFRHKVAVYPAVRFIL